MISSSSLVSFEGDSLGIPPPFVPIEGDSMEFSPQALRNSINTMLKHRRNLHMKHLLFDDVSEEHLSKLFDSVGEVINVLLCSWSIDDDI